MKRAAEEREVDAMTNEQSTRMELLARFYEVQIALDKVTDPASRTILEEQKKGTYRQAGIQTIST